ncbi:MAG: hypothetical protein NVSMB64_28040 [Candidatus Velthaea sp.]
MDRRLTIVRTLTIAAITVATGSPGVFAQNAPLGGDEIYARALSTWAAQPSPPVLAYNVKATVTHKGRVREERERVVLRTADRIAIVAKVGIDKSGSERVTRVAFERPRFDPDATFRLVPRSRVDGGDDPAVGSPRTITHVVARAKRYAVELVGESPYRDRSVYELRLTPLFDPKTNGVRKMFVDTKSFVTWKVVNETPYAVGPARGTFMLDAEYGPVGSSWLITRVTTSGAFRFGLFAYGGDGDVEYRIKELAASVPEYCFARSGYESHAECASLIST